MSHSRHDTMYRYRVQQHYSTLKYSLQAIKISAYNLQHSSRRKYKTFLIRSIFWVSMRPWPFYLLRCFFCFQYKTSARDIEINHKLFFFPERIQSDLFYLLCANQDQIEGKSQISCSRLFSFINLSWLSKKCSLAFPTKSTNVYYKVVGSFLFLCLTLIGVKIAIKIGFRRQMELVVQW